MRLLAAVSRHEITHALGFSSRLFAQFHSSVVVNSVAKDRVTQYQIALAASPNVLTEVRRHFGCSSLLGAELEDGGGDGTAGSHWEKTRFGEEYMIGSISTGGAPIYSRLTFALLQDSGWYVANLNSNKVTQINPWGSGVGCDFANMACNSNSWKTQGEPYYCEKDGASDCSLSHQSMVFCTTGTKMSAAVPAQYRYFADPAVVGSDDELSDYCPIMQPARSCATVKDAKDDDPDYLEGRGEFYGVSTAVGSQGMCYKSSLMINKSKYKTWVAGARNIGCYETACASSVQLKVRVGSHWYDCPSLRTIQIPYDAFQGELICPDTTLICGSAPVDLEWPRIQSVQPTSITRKEGLGITVTGAAFANVTSIVVSGVKCAISFRNDTTMICSIGSPDFDSDDYVKVATATGKSATTIEDQVSVQSRASSDLSRIREWLESDCNASGSTRVNCWIFILIGGILLILFIIAIACLIVKRRKYKRALVQKFRTQAASHYQPGAAGPEYDNQLTHNGGAVGEHELEAQQQRHHSSDHQSSQQHDDRRPLHPQGGQQKQPQARHQTAAHDTFSPIKGPDDAQHQPGKRSATGGPSMNARNAAALVAGNPAPHPAAVPDAAQQGNDRRKDMRYEDDSTSASHTLGSYSSFDPSSTSNSSATSTSNSTGSASSSAAAPNEPLRKRDRRS